MEGVNSKRRRSGSASTSEGHNREEPEKPKENN